MGWTQEDLGERAGLHPSYIGQIERADKKVSLATVERLASALGISVGYLLNERSPADNRSAWETRIGGLFRKTSAHEKTILYSTLKHLARSIRRKKGRP